MVPNRGALISWEHEKIIAKYKIISPINDRNSCSIFVRYYKIKIQIIITLLKKVKSNAIPVTGHGSL
jgi:hypothetical protein